MIEVEVKIRIDDRESVERKIKGMGRFVGEEWQEDIYFDAPHRNFLETGEVLRVRKIGGEIKLTYKRSKADEEARVREETEVGVDSPDIVEILENLGFRQIAWIKKRRRIYEVGSCKVEIDTVEDLGDFVEVEVKLPEGEDVGKEIVFKTLKELGIEGGEVMKKPYLELYLERVMGCKRSGS